MDRDEVLQKEIALKSGSGNSVVPDLQCCAVSMLRSRLLSEKRNMSPEKKVQRAQRISIFSLFKSHTSFASILSNEKFLQFSLIMDIKASLS